MRERIETYPFIECVHCVPFGIIFNFDAYLIGRRSTMTASIGLTSYYRSFVIVSRGPSCGSQVPFDEFDDSFLERSRFVRTVRLVTLSSMSPVIETVRLAGNTAGPGPR